MTVAAGSLVIIPWPSLPCLASVIFNTAKLATDTETTFGHGLHSGHVADNRKTIKEGQTVTTMTTISRCFESYTRC